MCSGVGWIGNFHVLLMQVAAKPSRSRNGSMPVTIAALKVRPYTVRKGDTLESIALKRGEPNFWGELWNVHMSSLMS
jgi:nucleoid-associated protein YgaU